MKLNLPIVDAEIRIPDDVCLISRTDTKGVITYANSYFAEISGYALNELIGKSHNIVRHPDVPPAVFADMWKTLKRGECWRGIVKNRAKSGRYYWVDACISPVYEGTEIVGYSSVRRRASPEQIAEAKKLYASVNSGGRLRSWWQSGWFRNLFTIRLGITLGIIAAIISCLVGATYSVLKIKQYQEEYSRLHGITVIGMEELGKIKFLMAENRAQLFMALLHDPGASSKVQHLDHTIDVHLETVSANRAEIERLWESFYGRTLEEPIRELTDRYWQARQRYVAEGLAPTQAALSEDGDFQRAAELLTGPLSSTYRQANALVDQLTDSLQRSSEAAERALRLRQDQEVAAMFWAGTAAALFFAICGLLFFRSIMRPLQSNIDNLSEIARGDLSRHPDPDVDGPGETRALSQAVAITHCNLLSAIDEIAQDASALSGAAARLNIQTHKIADGTDEQHERTHLLLDKISDSASAIRKLSIQAEEMNDRAEGVLHLLDSAEVDINNRMNLIRQLVRDLRALLDRSSRLLEPPAHGVDELPPEKQPSMESLESLVAEMVRLIEAMEPVLVGSGTADDSWSALKDLNERLAALVRDFAIDIRLQTFAAEDIQQDIEAITEFLVDNRQASHSIWSAAHQVLDLAISLEKLSSTFVLAKDTNI